LDPTPALWLIVVTLPLIVLTRWLNQHLQGVGLLLTGSEETAMLLHYLILLPGIVLHELSHFVAAKVVGVKTRGLSLRPSVRRGGAIRFGAVNVAKSDPFRESWIGLAPLLTGVGLILLVARWHFGVQTLPSLGFQNLGLLLRTSWHAPDSLLGLYLIFAVSNSMWPSESDRQPWAVALLFFALLAGMVYVSGLLARIPEGLGQWGLGGATLLVLAFTLSISVDLVFAALLLAVEKVGERLLGRYVEY